MGSDAYGNRYYENRVDYPFGQHRWVEPSDIHNFDSTQIPPEWHGWMCSINDATPSLEEEYIQEKMKHVRRGEVSHAPYFSNLGHQEPYFNFHGMHNQSQIRSRGYNIGNHVVGLPPGAPDGFYTQPGSPYNEASIRKFGIEGELSGGRAYKNELWRQRLMTDAEKAAEKSFPVVAPPDRKYTQKERAILARGGTLAKYQEE